MSKEDFARNMKFKILTNRTKYELNEEVETHKKATNYRALCNLAKQGEAKLISAKVVVPPKKVIKKK